MHGGAGDIPEESRPRHREGCLTAARVGGAVLVEGGTAVDAVCAAVEVLENDTVFNAGTGCALTQEGKVALDAAIMCGASQRLGGLAVLRAFRNPVRIAATMLDEEIVLLAGPHANAWAEAQDFEPLEDSDLIVPRSQAAYEKVVREGGASNWAGGTVGAVARDAQGRLAAATSTGGTMGKPPGRIGDSPLAGSGTWADGGAAVSCTGEGEAFIRSAFAVRLADAVEQNPTASDEEWVAVLARRLQAMNAKVGGTGGAILLTATSGPIAATITKTMSHAWWSPLGEGSGD